MVHGDAVVGSGLAAAAAAGGAARKVQAAFSAYLTARQAFANSVLDLAAHDDASHVTLEALVQGDVAAALCCPLIQDPSPGVRTASLRALAKLSAAAPPLAEAFLLSGVVDAVARGLAPEVGAGVQAAANAAVQALAQSGVPGAARAIIEAGAGSHLRRQIQRGASPGAREAAVRSVEALIVADASLVPRLVGGDALAHFVELLWITGGGGIGGGGVGSGSASHGGGAPGSVCSGGSSGSQGGAVGRLRRALLSCLTNLCSLSPAAAEDAERAGALRAAAAAAAQPGAPPAVRGQALLLLAHAARHSPGLARAAAAAGGAAPAVAALAECGAAPLRTAGAAMLLEVCQRGGEELVASIFGAPGAAAALAQHLRVEREGRERSGEEGAAAGVLLAGAAAGASEALARALLAARVPHELLPLLDAPRGGPAAHGGAAAWALQQFAERGGGDVATALADAGALRRLLAAYGRLAPAGRGRPKRGGAAGDDACKVKAAAKALIRGCGAAEPLAALVGGDAATAPPALLRHVLERLDALLRPPAEGPQPAAAARGGGGAAAVRKAFVASGALAELHGVAAAAGRLAGGDAKLERRLAGSCAAISELFPPEVVEYYSEAAAAVAAPRGEVVAA
ncbi:MAG: hypothetical protein J3K34DRAFT_509507 [Monoraphidium minutum]|nr:MAG: hypothetical protein J3K34DRAFT_509507 [Monoraphidium minutum]